MNQYVKNDSIPYLDMLIIEVFNILLHPCTFSETLQLYAQETPAI